MKSSLSKYWDYFDDKLIGIFYFIGFLSKNGGGPHYACVALWVHILPTEYNIVGPIN